MSVSEIEGLTPATLWKKFYEICQIPRPSKHEERLRLYLRNFAGQNDYQFKEDKTGNIVIQIPPKPGYENSPTVVLQSHIDMVCEKNKETVHDFLKDPITLIKEGDWIKAKGTTLGADNGIGAAAALAIAQDNDFDHGPLELLFTVDEETGLTGVNNLEKGFINGKILLNLDTEEDGAFYVGCSGGVDTVGTIKIDYEELKKDYRPFTISISGLCGGHSGINIADGRANAIKLLGLVLDQLTVFDIQLVEIQGGSKRNAIPREAEAVIFMNPEFDSKVREIINGFSLQSMLEFKNTEKNIKVTFEKKETSYFKLAYTKELLNKIINIIIALPHGVVAMSPDIPGLVETSTNLALIYSEDSDLIIGTSQRSSDEKAKENIARNVQAIFGLCGASINSTDGYPGWRPNMKSRILEISKQVYENSFSKTPHVKAVHAGLECGILGNKYPGIDMISFGPTIEGAHSPDEKVKIEDVDKFYTLLKNILIALIKQ